MLVLLTPVGPRVQCVSGEAGAFAEPLGGLRACPQVQTLSGTLSSQLRAKGLPPLPRTPSWLPLGWKLVLPGLILPGPVEGGM